MKNNLFLLGGYDLEMLTIKSLLDRYDIPYIDHRLDWNTARVSSYRDDIAKAVSDGKMVWGIELQEDCELPVGYNRIDHHNQWSDRPSSLEQVAALLKIPMERDLQLVAANDVGHIAALMQMGAGQDEIDAIRKEDRKAQGVTEEDERLAEESVRNHSEQVGELRIIRSLTDKFSPVCDRVYPCPHLLVYTDSEWVYYGKAAFRVAALFGKERKDHKIYTGGGANGYVGTVGGAFSREELQAMMTKIKQRDTLNNCEKYTSYHVFYFSFKWNVKGMDNRKLSEQIDLKQIQLKKDTDWKRVTSVAGAEAESLYNEKNYFYKFVHKALYDDRSEETLLMHFEHQKPQREDIRYKIKVKDFPEYDLKVEAINLNLYATGVGALSFHLGNEDPSRSTPDDILRINQYGRRVILPFFGDKETHSETAESICIAGLGKDEDFKEKFDTPVNEPWKTACFISSLISGVAENMDFEPLLEDRMFVLSWYVNDRQVSLFKGRLDAYFADGGKDPAFGESKDEDFWYKYLFVDSSFCTCQNDAMRMELLRKHTYPRWEKYGSLYGSTRYSMVFLTDSGALRYSSHLFVSFETIYTRMVELVLTQRAAMLRFSEEVTKVSYLSHKETSTISERISSLYKEYIHFVNQVYFREITSQDQGIELYDQLQRNLRMEEYVKDLDDEIGELHQYVSLMDDRDRNRKATILNNLAAFCLPMTIMTGVWGMNSFSGDWTLTDGQWWQVMSLLLAFILGLTVFLVNRKSKL